MATYGSYTPTTTIGRAMFNFDETIGISNFKYSGIVRVSVSDSFNFSDFLSSSYSDFYSGLFTDASDEVTWTAQMISNINDITSIYSQFANITFQNVGDFDTFTAGTDFTPNPEDVGRANVSDINITGIYRTDVSFSGISGVSSDNLLNYTGAAGDIFLNAFFADGNFTLDLGTVARQTLMHELGHSLGLSHPHSSYNVNTGVPTLTIDYAATKDLGFNQLGFRTNSAVDMYKEYFTIMSYDDQSYFTNAHTPMILDVIALQQAYGEGSGTHGSNNDTIEAGTVGYRTYFDKGGIDTIDMSLYTGGAALHMGVPIVGAAHLVGVAMSLNDALTTIVDGGNPAHLRWFYGEYENAIGSSNVDFLIGNGLANVISGLGGDDYIEGGGGNDSLAGGDNDDELLGGDGDDILDGGQQFDILDGGAGTDAADYRFFNFDTSVNLITGRVDFPAEFSDGGQFDTLLSIENVLLGAGSDIIRLPGGNINNLVNGFAGTDSVHVPYAYGSGYSVSGTASNLVMAGAAGIDTFQNIENFIFNDGRQVSSSLVLSPAVLASPTDFDGDGRSDILWQHKNGAITEWLMNGTNFTQSGLIGGGGDPKWRVVSSEGDFNGDGKADLLWQHTNGTVTLWFMNGMNFTQTGLIGGGGNPDWKIKGTGDFNGDGKADIAWQHTNGGAVLWLGTGAGDFTQSNVIGTSGGPSWEIEATGDINGDGRDDILWQRAEDGAAAAWLMNGTTFQASSFLNGSGGDPNWDLRTSGDFDGDGKDDILLQHATTGAVIAWRMDGTTVQPSGLIGGNGNPTWEVKGTGDYNNDGRGDLIWQQHGTGAVFTWQMNGFLFTPSGLIGGGGDTNWQVIAMG